MKPAAVLAVLVALALPASAGATPVLSLAQGRWFVERAVGPWDEHYRITDCQRTSSVVVACGVTYREPLRPRHAHVTELAELQPTGNVLVTLPERILSPAETAAVCSEGIVAC